MIKSLHETGVKSDYAYIAGLASIGFNWVSYLVARLWPTVDRPQADRWGIFVATWAPTMFALGTALRWEEEHEQR